MDKNKTLFNFIREHKWDNFKEYLDNNKDIDINIRDNDRNYLIHYVIIFNKFDLISLLIKRGSKLDIIDTDGRSIIYIPIKYRYIECLKLLLEHNKHHFGISILDIQDINGNIPLHYAIMNKNLEYINILIENGSNINTKDNDGNNSLHLAIFSKNIEIVTEILKNNMEPGDKSKSPLRMKLLRIRPRAMIYPTMAVKLSMKIEVLMEFHHG